MIKLFNSLTHSVEDLNPSDKGVVSIYSCGPTVYDSVHIGNLRSFIFVDTLAKVIRLAGYKTNHVMNITDVDDKMIARSQSLYKDQPPEEALHELARQYEIKFMSDIEAVNIDTAKIHFIKATESIDLIVGLIKSLYKAGFAYIADDGVYFSIEKYIKSGKKYGQLVDIPEESFVQSRINNDEYDKDEARDFALWKIAKPNEPVWQFELDGKNLDGRPGWHIECSAMSTHELEQPFDIHTGGIDLLFPHHENEIAQSTAGHKQKLLAKVFVHNEHLLVNNKKMSKSLGNIYTLEDLLERKYNPQSFRLFCLSSNFRTLADFSWENLDSAQSRLNNLQNLASLKWQAADDKEVDNLKIEDTIEAIKDSLFDDINTAEALSKLSQLQNKLESSHLPKSQLNDFKELLKFLDSVFSLNLSDIPDINENQKELIANREIARNNSDFGLGDELRARLSEQGIGLRDTNLGPIWFRE